MRDLAYSVAMILSLCSRHQSDHGTELGWERCEAVLPLYYQHRDAELEDTIQYLLDKENLYP